MRAQSSEASLEERSIDRASRSTQTPAALAAVGCAFRAQLQRTLEELREQKLRAAALLEENTALKRLAGVHSPSLDGGIAAAPGADERGAGVVWAAKGTRTSGGRAPVAAHEQQEVSSKGSNRIPSATGSKVLWPLGCTRMAHWSCVTKLERKTNTRTSSCRLQVDRVRTELLARIAALEESLAKERSSRTASPNSALIEELNAKIAALTTEVLLFRYRPGRSRSQRWATLHQNLNENSFLGLDSSVCVSFISVISFISLYALCRGTVCQSNSSKSA